MPEYQISAWIHHPDANEDTVEGQIAEMLRGNGIKTDGIVAVRVYQPWEGIPA